MKNINALIKIFLAVVISVNVTFVNAYAFATKRPEFPEKKVDYRSANDVWYDDFTSYKEGKKPQILKITENPGVTMNIVSTVTPDYKEKNIFRISDTVSTARGNFIIPVPETEKSFTFITRFKYNSLEAGQIPQFVLYGGTSTDNAFHVNWTDTSPFKFVVSSPSWTEYPFMKDTHFESGVWYTLKIYVDIENRATSLYLQGDTIKKEGVTFLSSISVNKKTGELLASSIPWNSSYTKDSIEQLSFYLYSPSLGEIDFDYMKIEGDSAPLTIQKEVVPKIQYTTIPAPVDGPSYGIINLTLNGEYFNVVNKPYIAGNLIMIKARDFAKLNGLIYMKTADEIIIKDVSNEIRIIVGSSEITVNGTKVTLPVNIGEDTFIPLNELGKLMNMTVNYNETTNTVEVIK